MTRGGTRFEPFVYPTPLDDKIICLFKLGGITVWGSEADRYVGYEVLLVESRNSQIGRWVMRGMAVLNAKFI